MSNKLSVSIPVVFSDHRLDMLQKLLRSTQFVTDAAFNLTIYDSLFDFLLTSLNGLIFASQVQWLGNVPMRFPEIKRKLRW